MDEELIEVITEDNAHVELEGVVESEVLDEDFEQSIDAEIAFEIAEIEVAEEIEVEIDESVAWTGGDNMRHYSLYGRDEADQHPISAITGLRDELNEIESLKTVYSDKTGFANYYKWHDGASATISTSKHAKTVPPSTRGTTSHFPEKNSFRNTYISGKTE